MKKNYLWSMLAVLLACVLCISSCKKDDDPYLSVSTNDVEFDSKGDGDGDVVITVAHTGWKASIPEGSTWIGIDSKSGDGSATITIKPKSENTSTKDNHGIVRITSTSGGLIEEISVVQKGAAAQLSIDETELEFDADGGSKSFNVTCNTDWTISGDPTWVTINPSSGNGDKKVTKVTVKVSENTTNDKRECELRIALDNNSQSETLIIKQAKSKAILTVGSNNINFACGDEKNFQGDTKSLQIRSNTTWTISGLPAWLGLSSTSGNGDQMVTLTTKSFNNSSKSRTATLTISCNDGSASATVTLSQEAGLIPDCTVSPTNIIILYNGVAFDYNYGKNVARYFRGYLEKSLVGTMSEREIIDVLEEKFDRKPVNKDEFTDFPGLDENTSYYIYTLGYDSEGKRGELTRVEITTKKRLDNWTLNEPMAWISEITQDDTYWYWEITKGTRCRTYLEGVTQNEALAYSSDVYQAWLLDYWRRTNQIYEYENPEPLMMRKTSDCCAVFTWGKDNTGVWASCIDWACVSNSSSSKRRASSQLKENRNSKKDGNHKIPKKETLMVRMIKK